MDNNKDYNSIKLLPYALSGLFLFCIIEMLLVSVFGFFGEIVLAADMFRHLFILALFLCTYRLTDEFKYFDVCNFMFICYAIMAILVNGLLLAVNIFEMDGISSYLSTAFDVLFEIVIMLDIVFLLKGICHKIISLGKTEKASVLRRLIIIWTSLYMVYIVAAKIILVYSLFYISLAVFIALLAAIAVLSVLIAIHVMKFCFSYYIYLYNNSSQLRSGRKQYEAT